MKNDKYPRSEKKTKSVSNSTGRKTRRDLITGGIAAGATLPFLPGYWTRPVVQSVLLPAHAQSSPGDCMIQLPDCNSDCQSPRSEHLYTFTCDENGCATYEREEIDTSAADPAPAENTVVVECGPEPDQFISAVLRDADGFTREANTCAEAESTVSQNVQGTIELECGTFTVSALLTASSGADASGNASGTASVTEITVVPA